ncbi:coiled-coil domain-containing protein 15 isoform X2 [Monodelphis domestica]|uniref:coiled-coil domain-containing protein 15 isoform X2 n=1 Tax=Monodelphis domestica TaxID=13616 RepID=UPI0024E21948|nr:coiled-coil domain-containing protein 15 isoform X2 [Monodelphis domestica]
MAVPGLQQRSLTKSGIQAPPPGRAVLCPRPSGCRHPPVLTQHSAVFARVQEPRMAQKPAPTRKSRCAPWVEQTFEKNRALLAVLAERSEAVAPIGAWVECPSPCGEEAPASVSASQLEEEFKEQQRLKEEALKRFQEQVKNRVNQQVRLRKKQQLQKSFEAVEKESTVAMQSSSLAPHLTPKGRANIFQSNLKSAIRSFDSNLPIQTLGDIEKKEEDENGAFQQQALALSQTLKQARQQLASRKTIDGEKPLGFSEDSMESSPTQEIALLRQPTSLRTGERGRKDSPLKDHPDQLLPAQASIRDQAEQKEEEREQQKKTCIRQLSAVSANGKRIEKPLPYHISGKIQAQETAENTNFGQLVTVSADGKETEKLLPYHLPDKVQAQETAEKPYFGQLLAAGSDDEETEKSLPYHILGNIQAQETAEIFTVDTTSEGRSKTFPVESYREQGVPYADVREEKKKPHFGLELSAVGADGKETERPLPYYIPGNIQSQETAEKPFFGQLSTVGADGKGTEKPFPYHIPGKVQFQETAEKPYFGQLSIVGADGKGTEKPFPYHIPGKVQAQETAEKPYFGQLSTVGADGKGTEKPFPYHIPGKVQAQETAELSTVGANSKGTKKSLPYYIPGNIQAQETIENTNFGQPSAVSADVKGTEKPLPYHIPGKVQVQETAEKPYFGQLLTVGTNSKGTKKPLPSHIPGKVQAWETAEKPYFGQLSAADADGKGTEKPLPYHISGKIQAQETAEKPHFGQLSAVGADGKGTEKPLSYHIQGKIQAQETAEVYGGPQSGSRSEFQNLPLFECGIDQEEDKKARQKQYLRYRRLFMDIERQQVKELERQRKFRKKIERVKKWKEQQRCIEEQKILRKTCQEDLDSGVKTCEISADSKLEDKKGAIKKHQRSRECIRYIEALRAQIQEKMRLYNIDLPPLCCCGPDFWDAHPDTCANNCIFYKNHQAYTQALHSVISSCEISENNSSMRLAIHNFASARRRNWKIQ